MGANGAGGINSDISSVLLNATSDSFYVHQSHLSTCLNYGHQNSKMSCPSPIFSYPAVHHYGYHRTDHQLAYLVIELHASKPYVADPYGIIRTRF